MANVEVYVSTDVEVDGPIPGPHSMLSFGSVAFMLDKKEPIGRFSANLELLPGAEPDPVTKEEFWDKNPEAWAACRKNPQPIARVMSEYISWLNQLPGKPVFVGYPATFDFMFLYHYIVICGHKSPFSFSALDIKTYASAVMKKPFRESTKRNMPGRWFSETKHTHIAQDDATEQGELFMAMLRENLASK